MVYLYDLISQHQLLQVNHIRHMWKLFAVVPPAICATMWEQVVQSAAQIYTTDNAFS
jgi:hypothetical protein